MRVNALTCGPCRVTFCGEFVQIKDVRNLPSPLRANGRTIVLLTCPYFLRNLIRREELPIRARLTRGRLALLCRVHVRNERLVRLLTRSIRFLIHDGRLCLILQRGTSEHSKGVGPFLTPGSKSRVSTMFLSRVRLHRYPTRPYQLTKSFGVHRIRITQRRASHVLQFLLSRVLNARITMPRVLRRYPLCRSKLLLRLTKRCRWDRRRRHRSGCRSRERLRRANCGRRSGQGARRRARCGNDRRQHPISAIVFPWDRRLLQVVLFGRSDARGQDCARGSSGNDRRETPCPKRAIIRRERRGARHRDCRHRTGSEVCGHGPS